ncbi:uncharacterized protein LOC110007471 isoform X1 [Amborella trichopoda]|uniref:uncharacterized protein LOC110007471 isoform X1 n=1 Tax=Amborella trichopoda TaxID=13333 RepID=UPI0009BCC6F1|nr:uncharacterized protein LOC110007471 isoform X1 [Amborella trichopoda]|eukprot:XP_020524367.1 uncharacterized protein LOC110007471 isoform X1 [Amborella trichopoda]
MDSQTMTSPTCLSPPPQESDPLLLKPVDWLIDLLSIHLNFISHFFSAISSTFYAFLSIVLECFHSTNAAQHKAEETAHQELEAISRAPFAVVEGGGLFAKKLVFGCLGATYGNFKSLVRGKRAIPAGHTFFVSVVLVNSSVTFSGH